MQGVIEYIDGIKDDNRRRDSQTLLELIQKICKEVPKLWNKSMVGFGTYHYKYASGREGEWFMTGFSSRKQSLVIYIVGGFTEYEELMKMLGKHKVGASCLYVDSLASIDIAILKTLITASIKSLNYKYKK